MKRHGHRARKLYPIVVEGFKKHNLQVICHDQYSYESDDLQCVLQSHKDIDLLIGPALYKFTIPLWKSSVREQWLNTKMNFISIERGPGSYRKQTFAMGYNGMIGEANFINSNSSLPKLNS